MAYTTSDGLYTRYEILPSADVLWMCNTCNNLTKTPKGHACDFPTSPSISRAKAEAAIDAAFERFVP